MINIYVRDHKPESIEGLKYLIGLVSSKFKIIENDKEQKAKTALISEIIGAEETIISSHNFTVDEMLKDQELQKEFTNTLKRDSAIIYGRIITRTKNGS